MDKSLPFERGTTWKTDIDATQTSDPKAIYGRIFYTDDSNPGHTGFAGHGTKQPVVLRALRNRSGATIGFDASSLTGARQARGRQALRASTADSHSVSESFNGYTSGQTIGGFGYVLDDAYGAKKSFIANDIVYAVDEGPVQVPTSTIRSHTDPAGSITSTTFLVPMTLDPRGRYIRARTAHVILGYSMQTFSSATTGSGVLMYVGNRFGSFRGR